jgi:hypothetical protein
MCFKLKFYKRLVVKCWRSFRTVATMDEHTCPPIIRDDSIVIHE